jgi:hypothetical protein
MHRSLLIFCFVMMYSGLVGQIGPEAEIMAEARKLYSSEMASWFGTDVMLTQYPRKRVHLGGYFSYAKGGGAVCIFFTTSAVPKVALSVSFDSTFNVNTAVADTVTRDLTTHERSLFEMRQIALAEYKVDTLFRQFKRINPNFVPVSDEKGKRVYILSGPEESGVVIFGNDYLLHFNDDHQLVEKKRIHRSLIPVRYGDEENKKAVATIHSHLPETGDYITATDICTLMLYCESTGWSQHIVISEKFVSLYDCKNNSLTILTREAWDKINKDQKKKRR